MDLYNASTVIEEDEPMVLSLEEYEDAKKHLQEIADRAESARRLSENADFKSLVLEGYLTDEPKRLAELMASGRLHESSMQNCAKSMGAIGEFRTFLREIIEQGNTAKDDLINLEEARDEAIKAEAEAQG